MSGVKYLICGIYALKFIKYGKSFILFILKIKKKHMINFKCTEIEMFYLLKVGESCSKYSKPFQKKQQPLNQNLWFRQKEYTQLYAIKQKHF